MKDASFKDFQKLDIRIGTVVEADVPKWSHWVMKLTVDFGKEVGKKIAFAGIMKFFKSDDLIDKQFPFIVNLEHKKIGPKEDGKQNYSECMMIMAVPKDDEETSPITLSVGKRVPNGTRVR
jgi:tRNA-binding protein